MSPVREVWLMRCPQCGDDSQLDIMATVQVRLTPEGTDADASEDGSHEWGDASRCICVACGYDGLVQAFRLDPPDDEPEGEPADGGH